MSSVAVEDGVLKLVRQGRNVEYYTRPITAAEVLKKYPRHSVTRPDVFEYPWVVVKPEAVLNLGKVFFIVPNHTIYKLLKAHKNKHQLSPSRNQSPENIANQQEAQNQDSPRKINAGSTPKHQNRHQLLSLSPPTTTCMWISSQDQDRDLRSRKQNKVGSWPAVMSKNKSTLRLEEKSVKGSRKKIRSPNYEEYHNIDTNMPAESPEMQDDDEYYEILFKQSREVKPLKSCLRKPDSVRKSLHLKVTFAFQR